MQKQLTVLSQGHFVIDASSTGRFMVDELRERAITIDNWWPVGVCGCMWAQMGWRMCECVHVHACILGEVSTSLPLHPQHPPSALTPSSPPHPPCLSMVWASDWGPWAQSPRKLHQSKQRGGTEPREYGDTKGLPHREEDFRRDSHKAEQPLNSEPGVVCRLLCFRANKAASPKSAVCCCAQA